MNKKSPEFNQIVSKLYSFLLGLIAISIIPGALYLLFNSSIKFPWELPFVVYRIHLDLILPFYLIFSFIKVLLFFSKIKISDYILIPSMVAIFLIFSILFRYFLFIVFLPLITFYFVLFIHYKER